MRARSRSGTAAFDAFLRAAERALAHRHDPGFAGEVVSEARAHYARIRPRVPDIGGRRNVFQPVMTVNGWLVALHLALKERGRPAAETVGVAQEVFDGWLQRLPGFVLRGLGRLALSRPALHYVQSQAKRSQERRHAEDFVWRLERGPDGEVSMVFDECAVNKWYDAQGVRELGPYCNFADVTYSRLMGMGVDAHETIGLGCERCALRFKQGRETPIPERLEGIVPPV